MPPDKTEEIAQEYEYMRQVLGSDAEVWKVLQHQFSVLQQRMQTIFTLGALGITVTGFSGHRIVAAGPASGIPLVIGLLTILVALCLALSGSSKLRWLSTFHGPEVAANFMAILAARNEKSRLFKQALTVLLVGLGWYVVAISVFLIRASFRQIPIY
ncbi:MAG TPA: hypothetical protein VLL73_06405 [Desulfurivibrionaceae bacterium]|nr:hypothetical protein [Desulfurivibrionaceae bacterium]